MNFEQIFSDLWVSSFWGPLVVGVLLFLGGKLFSDKTSQKTVTLKYVQEVIVKRVIEINHIQHNRGIQPSRTNTRNQGDDFFGFFCLAIFFLSSLYVKHQTTVIAVTLGLFTFVLSFTLFTMFFRTSKSVVHDASWQRFLVATLILAILGYPLMYVALHPVFTPSEIIGYDNTLEETGFQGILRYYGLKGLTFYLFQTLGFFTLAIAMFLQVTSLTFYTVAIQLAVSTHPRPVLFFIARLTSGFSSPSKIFISSAVCYTLSFILISGLGYAWLYNSSPNSISSYSSPPKGSLVP